jgi:hypothetical protein
MKLCIAYSKYYHETLITVSCGLLMRHASCALTVIGIVVLPTPSILRHKDFYS